ncbi:MAG: S-layer family protein, partial [Symploca sp. SIO1C4]|nr:S-layer family protein [Symploca sp. SIO1C4]
IKLLANGDISLINGALVTATGNGGGGIEILGDRVSITDGSGIVSNTTGSELGREVLINASQLTLTDGAVVLAGTLGEGGGGSLTLNASESVQVIGTAADGELPSILTAQTLGKGNAGNLTIRTPKLLIIDGAQVNANTFSEGAGGNLTVEAAESVTVMGESADGEFASSLATQADQRSAGNAGNLTISTPTFVITDGAFVSTRTLSEGDGGSLTVNASESVQVIGRSANDEFASFLSTNTEGKGNAGNLIINTSTLLIADGAFVDADTFGEGAGGSLMVDATESVQVIGESADGKFASALTAQTEGQGNAGNLTISTPTLLIADGALVSASTLGEGDGGILTVNASKSVQVIGESVNGRSSSAIATQSQGKGNAGDLTITTQRLLVVNGGFISTSAFREGA